VVTVELAPARPVWRIVQITDIHLFGNSKKKLLGLDTYRSFQAVFDQIQAHHWPPDLILVTGDLAQDGTKAAYELFCSFLSPWDVPTYWLPGNHDDPQLMAEVLACGSISPAKQILLPPWQVVLLDSTIPHEVGGYLAPGQMDFLKQCLATHPDLHTLVCLHHHPVSVNCRWMQDIGLSNGPEFFTLLKDYPQVHGVLWGHIHQLFEEQHQGIQLMATPSTCIQFKPQTTDFSLDTLLPGYRWLELQADGYLRTGVERIAGLGQGQEVDMASQGY